jgi:predicted phage-related endonuclease
MTRKIFYPENEAAWHALRCLDVTSTESAALFGMSPYATAFEIWHRKREATPLVIEAEGRMLWGQRLQDVIARGVAEDYGVKVRKMTGYQRIEEIRMGSSFDFEIIGGSTAAAPCSAPIYASTEPATWRSRTSTPWSSAISGRQRGPLDRGA